MASHECGEVNNNLDSYASGSETERNDKFWNSSVSSMKFTVERQWLSAVRKARRRPNYGMTTMDSLLEEVVGNKLELAGPMIDGYLHEIGKSLRAKLSKSKMTGLVNPVVLFIPWAVYRHILVLLRGYSADLHSTRNGSKHCVTITSRDTLQKLFSPERLAGETYFSHRHFKKVCSEVPGKMLSTYNGKSTIVASAMTPFCMDYATKKQRVTVTFYIQCYSAQDYAIDTSLQSLMNQ